ncbi:hypothetical protein F4810DRAFT_606439 [Camillea tinctor]|nr:hypothetical protein F4810DRAFT_606439 [Camillea tinctor]
MHRRIRDVKQHLHRRHTSEYYCPRCFQVFNDPQRYEAHNTSVTPCSRSPSSQLEGITIEQGRALSKKSNKNHTEDKQWFTIWDILFPGSEKPSSAYIDCDLAEDMSSFHEYWTNRGHNILMDGLNSSGIWVLSIDQRDVQGRQILAGAMNLVYEQWVSRRNRGLTSPRTPSSSTSSLANKTNDTPRTDSLNIDDDATNSILDQEFQYAPTQLEQLGFVEATRQPEDHRSSPVMHAREQVTTEIPRVTGAEYS